MGLALDAPRARDLRVEAGGVTFLLDPRVLANMAQYLPFTVDHDPRSWLLLRVRPARPGAG